eukprot:TRINITY_DN4418_c0_g1_i5.p1 TRINITY_DN4418_c0_g1~~TRINITY_DN4418_c0_g1_i5.p1  ORF type:complete len:208 (-),score=100.76 TRINITY_DN4418_c0_g1_i5:25-648(-)
MKAQCRIYLQRLLGQFVENVCKNKYEVNVEYLIQSNTNYNTVIATTTTTTATTTLSTPTSTTTLTTSSNLTPNSTNLSLSTPTPTSTSTPPISSNSSSNNSPNSHHSSKSTGWFLSTSARRLKRTQNQLLRLLRELIDQITTFANCSINGNFCHLPPALADLFQSLEPITDDIFPGSASVLLSTFFFLRMIVPALVTPEAYFLLPGF